MSPKREEGGPRGLHADEGEIHAFLDGAVDLLGADRAAEVRAHMDGCRPCRDRLAVEAAVRDRADTLLGADDPLAGAVLPTLEELQARAAATGGAAAAGSVGGAPVGGASVGGPRSSRRFDARAAMGWAATVILSLGVGYGVGVVGPRGGAPGAPSAAPVMLAPEVGSGEVASDAAQTSAAGEAAPVAGGVRQRVAEATPEPAAPTAGRGAVAPAPAQQPAPAAAVDSLAAVSATAAPSPLPLTSAAADSARRRTAGAAGDSALRGTAADAAADSTLRRALADAAPAAAPPAAPPTAQPAPSSLRTADRPSPLDPAVVAELQAVRAGRAEAAGAAGAAEEAEAASSGLIGLALPGSTVRDVRWGEVWPGQEGVVVEQELADGRRVELRMAGAPVGGVDTVAAPPAARVGAPDGWSRAVRALEGGWAALDGPLPVGELAELLAGLR